ncbi:MAG: sigma factor-like helix-turn-helix DNA-binding protein, partial [Myxococcaceae bacterium]
WVRAAATRQANDLHRKDQGAPLPEQSMWDRLPLEGVDLELGLIKAEHQEKFGEAFAHTLSGLTARERTLLRMHLLDGLSFEEIGAFYRVNRSTACRWVAAARREVLKGTQAYLSDQLGLTRSEMASVLRGVRSQVDLRISGYLARSQPA